MSQSDSRRRILIIDDNPSIHADFEKIFRPAMRDESLIEAEAAFFGGGDQPKFNSPTEAEGGRDDFELVHADCGPAGMRHVEQSLRDDQPFDVAFIDMRMPESWDGLTTIERLWELDDQIHVVLCTAYSDLNSSDMNLRLGQTDRLLFLKKPFDSVEAIQVAVALSEKRRLTAMAASRREELELLVEERTARLNRALMESRAASRAKAEFVSIISHELKTPLNSILGFSGILKGAVKSAGLSAMHAEAVDAVQRNGQQLLKLINHILDFVDADADRCRSSLSACQAGDIGSNATGYFARHCEEKGVSLKLMVEAGLAPIQTDPRYVDKILNHLLDNAIKFTEPGGSIELSVGQSENDTIYRVRDSGPGIESSRIDDLFTPFQQVDGSHTRRYGGAGLGLSLCQRLAQALNAELTVESQVGVGSTFTLRLPGEVGKGNGVTTTRQGLTNGEIPDRLSSAT